MRQKPFDIRTTEQRCLVFLGQPDFEHEQHCEHDQGHVMMPPTPFANLIVGHARLTLGVFERPFDPISPGLHSGQDFGRSVGGGVGQGNQVKPRDS